MPRYGELSDNPKKREQSILDYWDRQAIYEESVEQRKGNERWVFYEGPPTANGRPHFGHLMARGYKDLFPRYKTMRGYHVERKGGWDTHGLPVELEVEKELGINSKAEIEQYGMEQFIEQCKESVWQYKGEWEQLIRRMGFWIDLEDPYVTYEDDYIESLWWELKRIWEDDLLYKGHKVLPYCPRCGTGLSSHEVAQGYEFTEDPSIYVKLPLRGEEDTYLLIWTTTPWTIPANTAVGISENFLYAKVEIHGDKLILAKALVDRVLGSNYEILEEIDGRDLLGLEYTPPYQLIDHEKAYQVYDAPFVSLEEGTGIVHMAPAFGVEDNEFGNQVGLPLFRPLDLEGKFTEDFPLAEGQFCKDADESIVEDLDSNGYLLRSETTEHEYPFCWRCETPLLYFALDSWYIETTARQQEIIANNQEVNWYPSHMRDGRFGDFLENMKDWALSRDRYWGTPLNIWECENCGKQTSVGSREELVALALDPSKAQEVELHRPYIDAIQLECPNCSGEMVRAPHVIDTWFDSGSMHTAQWHYPFENQEKFDVSFPADFICEGQDQTRGWFYTLLVTATLLYDQPAFKNVVVTGYGLDSEGKAMSKSRGNVIDPWEMIEEYGADALRWYLFSSTAPWKTRRLEESGPGEALYQFLDTLENVYNFFSLYADIDEFEPSGKTISSDRLLDRWVLSRLHRTTAQMTESLDDYDIVAAARAVENFIDDLSNWFIRCSRERFWSSGDDEGKRAAYNTLHTCLLELTKLLAPFVPFLAEEIYRNIATEDPDSVHLCDWPQPRQGLIDETLENNMKEARKLTVLGRRARNQAEIKVRQPLPEMIVSRDDLPGELPDELLQLISEELNVKDFVLTESLDGYYYPQVRPNYRKIGPKYGDRAQEVGAAIEQQDRDFARTLEEDGQVDLEVEGETLQIKSEDVILEHLPRSRYVEIQDDGYTVLLNISIDDDLRQEGYVRELIRRIQQLRKEAEFEVTDRINIYCKADQDIRTAIEKHVDYLKSETLTTNLFFDDFPDNPEITSEEGVDGKGVQLALLRKQ